MTDTTATTNTTLWIPPDVWSLIASFLDNDELAQFRKVCKLFNGIGSHVMILQPLFNRLRAIDNTLPADLQTAAAQAGKSPLIFFKEAFEKIQARQQQEIAYLTRFHPTVMAKPEYTQALQQSSSVSLKSLEAKNVLLDEINSEIIKEKIDINSTSLNLRESRITRLPVTIFQSGDYANFGKSLISLDCANNQLIKLDVQGLTALQMLNCENNRLITLNLKGLAALQMLNCESNRLTTLNLQGLTALQVLNLKRKDNINWYSTGNSLLLPLVLGPQYVKGLAVLLGVGTMALHYWSERNNNPLIDLNLTGTSAIIKNKYAELEKTLLFKQLSQSSSAEARQGIIARLGADYTYKNCLYYCPVYAAKLFTSDSASQVYNLTSFVWHQTTAYLPSRANDNNTPVNPRKRLRNEGQGTDDNKMNQEANSSASQEKESGDEPDAKRRKKS